MIFQEAVKIVEEAGYNFRKIGDSQFSYELYLKIENDR